MNFLGACGTLIGHPLDTIKTWQQFGNRRIRKSVYDIIIQNNGVSNQFMQVVNSIIIDTAQNNCSSICYRFDIDIEFFFIFKKIHS